ncbi:peroxiredoxin family protein [Cytobacillus sp. Hm23]
MTAKVKDCGLSIGDVIPDATMKNWDNTYINLFPLKQRTALFFVSLGCYNCIDLLPFIKEIQLQWNIDIILFSSGSKEDHAEMADYFKWSFSIISLETDDMEKVFNVTHLPFTIIVDDAGKVINKGVVYNNEGFKFLYEEEN